MAEPSLPFIGVRMHKNRTQTGRRTGTPAKHAATYFAFGKEQNNRQQTHQTEKQRGEWLGPDGRLYTHQAVLDWAKEMAMSHHYTFEALLSVQHGDLTPAQFCQAMGQSEVFTDWRLICHQDTDHRHAHILFFHDRRLDKPTFLAWQTAVRQELSLLEQKQLSAAPAAALEHHPDFARAQTPQPTVAKDLDARAKRAWEKGMGQA